MHQPPLLEFGLYLRRILPGMRRLVLSHRVVMAQHFLLSAATRSLSTAKIMRMSDSGVENVFLRLRWPEPDGMPVCPGCGGMICNACPRISGHPRWRCKACRGDFSITSGTLLPGISCRSALVELLTAVRHRKRLPIHRSSLPCRYRLLFDNAKIGRAGGSLDRHVRSRRLAPAKACCRDNANLTPSTPSMQDALLLLRPPDRLSAPIW
jgi:Transposase zinc-ribbon domain